MVIARSAKNLIVNRHADGNIIFSFNTAMQMVKWLSVRFCLFSVNHFSRAAFL